MYRPNSYSSARGLIMSLLVAACCLSANAQSNAIFVSEQGSAGEPYEGSYDRSTQARESGKVTLTKNGPINYTVSPTDLTIGPEDSKSWTGTISADPNQAPPAGTNGHASIVADYEIEYSRPEGSGSDGTVTGTHKCSGCSYHGEGNEGTHETVKQTGQDSITFEIVSIHLDIEGKTDNICAGDTVEFTAKTYPEHMGQVTWSNDKTGEKIEFVAEESMDLTATLDIEGARYQKKVSLTVNTDASDWETTQSLGGGIWEAELWKAEKIKQTTKQAMKAVPANITVTGPEFEVSFAQKDCCHEGAVTENGEKKVTGSISGAINGKVPMASPPWTASIDIKKQKYGYEFAISCEYGLFLEVGAELSGELGYRMNQCTQENCFTGALGINIPISLALTASGSVCLQKANTPSQQCAGTTQAGAQCRRMTTNSCGYCSSANNGAPLHTEQSWWCFSCPSFSVTPAKIGSNFYGGMTYNEDGCDAGFKGELGIGPVTFSSSIGVLGYNFEWSYEIWPGSPIYP